VITTLLCTVKSLAWLETALEESQCRLISVRSDTLHQYTAHLEGGYRQITAFLTLAIADEALY
jgi:hypothetical protein